MRQLMTEEVADAILDLPAARFHRVAVDGVVGAGMIHYADELARELSGRGTPVVRASVDGFHNPARTRRRRGRDSPEGFYRDSFDYGRFIRLLLDPFGPDGSGNYVQQVYDVRREREVSRPPALAEPGTVLVVDGIFLHRDELVRFWDYTVWLDAIGDADLSGGMLEGQRLYRHECDPRARAGLVVDNREPKNPPIAIG
ncbi:nucleoside/nucleotide kinase family protein [Actinophytocola sediminis]